MNLPNSITVARIVLVPVFLVLAYGFSDASAIGAWVVFTIASVSDLVDGYLARKNAQVSRLGQFLDPLADKLLVGAALVALVDTRLFPLWAAIVISVREIAVQILRTRIVSAGGTLPASPMAKFKTVTQLCMVGWWLLPWNARNGGHWLWLALALITTLGSGYSYFTAGTHTRRALTES